ncbi:MAG: 30S ribosomal protein S3 [Erysipelotrichaceae bacterium]|jgi:small subunit ribosomal protein S3|nr:30S ribosomal protein S3 [Erysipelotrichaceae bacterium]
MGQKVNPVGFRVGINRDWNSKWFAVGSDYANFLEEDIKIRRYLDKQLKTAMLSRIEIGRVKNDKGHAVRIAVYVGRPGDVLGQEGENVKRLRTELSRIVKSGSLHIDVVEVKNPDLDATLVAKWIASELENRAAFRSTMKKALIKMRKAGAKGCRTLCSGRLAGAEIARCEGYKEGVVPLHTLRADIDFASVHAATTYGNIGVKVWICRSLNKTDTATVNEPAPRDPRDERRDPRRRPAPKGDVNNAATKAR